MGRGDSLERQHGRTGVAALPRHDEASSDVRGEPAFLICHFSLLTSSSHSFLLPTPFHSLHFAPFLSLFCPAQLPMPHLFPLTPPLPHAFALLAPSRIPCPSPFSVSLLVPSSWQYDRAHITSLTGPHLLTPAPARLLTPSRPSSHQLKRPFQCSSVHLVARIATHPMASGCKQARTYCQLLWRRRSNGPVLPASCL